MPKKITLNDCEQKLLDHILSNYESGFNKCATDIIEDDPGIENIDNDSEMFKFLSKIENRWCNRNDIPKEERGVFLENGKIQILGIQIVEHFRKKFGI